MPTLAIYKTREDAIRALKWQQVGQRNAPPRFQATFAIKPIGGGRYALMSEPKK